MPTVNATVETHAKPLPVSDGLQSKASTRPSTPVDELGAANIATVQRLVGEYMKGNPAGYLAGCSDDFKGVMFAGLVPGGEDVRGIAGMEKMMEEMPRVLEVKRFEPKNWAASGENVFFTVDWQFIYIPTGKTIDTTAVVRKVVRDGKICEKYHMINAEVIKATGASAAASPTHSYTNLVIAHFKCQQGKLSELEGLFKKLLPETRKCKGCISIDVVVDKPNNQIILLQDWESNDDHTAYVQWRLSTGLKETLDSVLEGGLAGLTIHKPLTQCDA